MKRFVFIAVALLAFGGAAAQQPSTMKFTADEWDFGTIKEEGGKVSHRFEFTNSGPNPFVIQKVETSCGCTTPTFTREPVLPGRKGYVEITYDPLYRPGSFRREVTVTSNDRKNINKLIIRGNVIATPRTPQQEFPVEVGGGLMASRTTVGVGYLARGTSQAGALLLPKLRSHFAEFLNNASPVGLRILSSSTCVGLRYGYPVNNSGFSWQPAHTLLYFFSIRITSSDCTPDLPDVLLPRLHRSFHSRLVLSVCVPTVLLQDSTGISTCYPSTTSFDLALGPDLPRADQLYSGNLGYSAWRIPTSISLLIPAFSLLNAPRLLIGTASPH